jgi:hypothetical protein
VGKIRALKNMCLEKGVNPWIEVDGGVTPDNAWKVIEAGANALVAGSAVFNSPSYRDGEWLGWSMRKGGNAWDGRCGEDGERAGLEDGGQVGPGGQLDRF